MMTRSKRLPFFSLMTFTAAVAAGVLTAPGVASAQAQYKEHDASPSGISARVPQRVWEDRGPIQNLDLYRGSTSAEREPAGPFTFLREDTAATNPKANVRDAKGVLWGVKWDEEVQAEVAATRLAWAMGLGVEETYYVPTGTIVFPGGRPTFQRIGSFIDSSGRFRSAARFERRGSDLAGKGPWPYGKNPLMRENGYSVLVLMNVIMGNWDAKDDNNKILSVTDTTGTTDWYMIGDYGACFGKMGGHFGHSKYALKDFVKNPPAIASVSGGSVNLGYKGTNAHFHASVPLEGARLFAHTAAQLSLKQVEDAFRAAHASEADLHGFARAVYDRIQQVVTAVQ
jgi:hypothetical protein